MFNLPAFNQLCFTYRTRAVGPFLPGANAAWYLDAREIGAPSLVTFTFAADPSAADRFIRLRFYIAGVHMYFAQDPTPVTANQTFIIAVGNQLPVTHVIATVNLITLPMPHDIFLSGGDDVRTFIDNIQAGDQISNAVFHYRSWLAAN